jgi:hypothetical protein
MASVVKYKGFLAHPISATSLACKHVLKISGVLSAAVGLTWGSVCLLNNVLPRYVFPTQRFYINGAIGGLPFIVLRNIRGFYLYVFRAALYSAWGASTRLGVSHSWRANDLWLFVLSWALIGSILEGKPSAIKGKGFRKCVAWMRGDGLADPVEIAARCRVKKATTQKKSEDIEP